MRIYLVKIRILAYWEMISMDRQVSATTSPAFIWTTKADKIFSYRHSELLPKACEQFGVRIMNTRDLKRAIH